MVRFVEIEPKDIPNLMETRRGRVSYPILKGFLETGIFVAKLDKTGVTQSHQNLMSSLGSYIRTHELPIKIFQRKGDIYLLRLDMTEEGEVIENWQKQKDEDFEDLKGTSLPITSEEVTKKFEEQKAT